MQNLAEKLGVEIQVGDEIAIIIWKIESADSYDKEFTLTEVGYIFKDREDQCAAEKERERGKNKEKGEINKGRKWKKKKRERKRKKEKEKSKRLDRESSNLRWSKLN